ncbi:MAG: exodeoxyribonuclease VII large subunit [Micrococcaceae bacterium]
MSNLPEYASQTTPENPWPVSHFSEQLKKHIEKAPATWIEGEILQFNQRSGTSFLTLKDLSANAAAQLTIWQSVLSKLPVTLQEGNRVVAYVKANYWIAGGRLSMQTMDIRPVGEGELLLRIEQLKNALAQEGLFNEEHKKSLPYLPQRIGLVTGKDSDALKDVLQNARRRWPAVQFEIREVAVQGKNAVQEVCEAIKYLDAQETVDVIIVARGGGSVEDLMPFNDEQMVRTIFAAQTPIVSAIGHEANRPIIDEVADLRASTPTDAAKRTVPDLEEQQDLIQEAQERMRNYMQSFYLREMDGLHSYLDRPVLKNPWGSFEVKEQELLQLKNRATLAIKNRVQLEDSNLTSKVTLLKALSPQHILDRGYAVIRNQNLELVKSVNDTTASGELIIALADGVLDATVHNIRRKDG